MSLSRSSAVILCTPMYLSCHALYLCFSASRFASSSLSACALFLQVFKEIFIFYSICHKLMNHDNNNYSSTNSEYQHNKFRVSALSVPYVYVFARQLKVPNKQPTSCLTAFLGVGSIGRGCFFLSLGWCEGFRRSSPGNTSNPYKEGSRNENTASNNQSSYYKGHFRVEIVHHCTSADRPRSRSDHQFAP